MSIQQTLAGRVTVWGLLITFSSMIWSADFADAQKPPIPPQPGARPPAGRDPTVPSLEIQRRTRPRPGANLPAVARPLSAPLRAVTRPVGSNPIALQSLIQSSPENCTATLRSGDQTVTVSFTRGQTKREVQLPGTQFADFASTVQRLSGELRQLRAQVSQGNELLGPAVPATPESENPTEPPERVDLEKAMAQAAENAEAEMLEVERQFMRQALQPQQIDLTSSFTLGGNLYRVIDFTSNTLLLEQVPLGKYVIVR